MNQKSAPILKFIRMSLQGGKFPLRSLSFAIVSQLASYSLAIGAPWLLCYSWELHGQRQALTLIAGPLIAIELLSFLRSPLRYMERMSSHVVGTNAIIHWRSWLTGAAGKWSGRQWSTIPNGEILHQSLEEIESLQDVWLRGLIPAGAALVAYLAALTISYLWKSLGVGAQTVTLPTRYFVIASLTAVLGTAALCALFPRLRSRYRDLATSEAAQAIRWSEMRLVATDYALLGVPLAPIEVNAAHVAEEARRRYEGARLQITALVALFTAGTIGVGLLAAAWYEKASSETSVNFAVVSVLVGMVSLDFFMQLRNLLDVLAVTSHVAEQLEQRDVEENFGSRSWPQTELQVGVGSYQLAIGQRLAVVGASGTGKSTLLRSLGLLDRNLEEPLYVNGHSLKEFSGSGVRRSVVYVPTEPVFLRDTIDEFIRVGRPETSDWQYLASKLGLTLNPADVPDGLSRGELHRLALVRALVGSPQVLLLDEPTAGLGKNETNQLLRLLEELPVVTIVATHDPLVTEWCTYVMNMGER
jgi:ABC-type transport system involved in cytochrome bd biosynthesis fused ATPase/permease subunit